MDSCFNTWCYLLFIKIYLLKYVYNGFITDVLWFICYVIIKIVFCFLKLDNHQTYLMKKIYFLFLLIVSITVFINLIMYLLLYTEKLDYLYDLIVCYRNGYGLELASQNTPSFSRIENFKIDLNTKYDYFLKSIEKRLITKYISYINCKFHYFLKCGILYEGVKKRAKNQFSPKFLLKYPINTNIRIEPLNQCKNDIELILAIISPSESFLERYTYRKIYCNYSFIQTFFFTTTSKESNINRLIKEENDYYRDIIQFDFVGEYYLLPYNMIGSLRWVNIHCKNYKYVVEHQIDIFLNIPYYLNHFHSISTVYPVISAVYHHQKVIHHIPKELQGLKRWYITYSAYHEEYWPDYPQGPCIFLSENTTKKVVNASYYVKKIIFMEDIYLGFLLQYSNISQYNIIDHRISSFIDVKFIDFDDIEKNYLWIHGLTPGGLYYISSNIYKYV